MNEYPKPCVRVVLKNEEGRVLLARKASTWDLPGQKLEGGKDWAASVQDCLSAVGAGNVTATLVALYADAGPEPTVTALFVAAGAPEKPVGDAEWFSSENLPSGLPKGARSGIADALSFRGNVVSR